MPMPARSPGRPRSPEADEAIIRATLELLAEVGYRNLSMELVRARAGVGKATIYRRYTGKDDLVKAAMRHLHHDLELPDDTGSFLGDVEALGDRGVAVAATTGHTTMQPQLMGEVGHDPELQSIFYEHLAAPRRALVRQVIERGIERGELRADIDVDSAVDMLIGAVVYRNLIEAMEPESSLERFKAAAAALLHGLRA